ncbi:MAG TPA: pilus assembly protein PilP [Burkholderiales bacterium]|nr:pilus assembly protein PilP [Burkholderiales bacterium]
MTNSATRIRIAGLSAVALAVALAGCGESAYQDLEQFVKQSGQGLRGKVEPLPEVKPYEAFSYTALDQPDPFKPRKLTPKFAGAAQPDPSRRREALEEFPLDNLRMVGTMERKGTMFALIRSPDNNLVQVKPGDYIGQNFGRVTTVAEGEVKVKELMQEASGAWVEREASLSLSDEAEAKQAPQAKPKQEQKQ